jgi:hypothetical protein
MSDNDSSSSSMNKNSNRSIPRSVLDVGSTYKHVVVNKEYNISVEKVSRLMLATPSFEEHRGRFAKIVWDKQGFRRIKCSSWLEREEKEIEVNSDYTSDEEYDDSDDAIGTKSSKSKSGRKRDSQTSPNSKSDVGGSGMFSGKRSLNFGGSHWNKLSNTNNNHSNYSSKLPRKVGNYRSIQYQVSNQWSSQCRVRCLQEVVQYDKGGGGIIVKETRQLPDIPWGKHFVILRKISIIYVGMVKHFL